MTNYKSEFLKVMAERGFIHQLTDAENLDKLMKEKSIAAYIGFDCTAISLHVGSLVQIMILRWLRKTGHTPIVLLGGATTKIGDPSGKDESRPPLSDDQIEKNKAGIRKNFEQFGLGKATFADNSEWLDKLNYIELLRRVGRYLSVNEMIKRESVKLRLDREQALSFLEFNYMVFQAYDFYELSQKYNCHLQIGGSDQWGNIISGIDLSRKLKNSEYEQLKESLEFNIFGLTTPLLTTSDGKKMGKTAAGAVWLSPELLSPYDYWQFWRNTADSDVERFLKLFTELDLGKIAEILSGNINEAKKILATEATALCHGREQAELAEETAKQTFEEGALGAALPVFEVAKSELEQGIPAYALFNKAGLAESGGEARRLIKGKGGKINDQVIEEEGQLIKLSNINSEGVIKLSAGKKKHVVVKPI